MGLRLLRWWHRRPAPAGRHARVLPVVSVPDERGGRLEARPVSTVGLVFADGASVELDPDDPRVRTFRAAAAALVDPAR